MSLVSRMDALTRAFAVRLPRIAGLFAVAALAAAANASAQEIAFSHQAMETAREYEELLVRGTVSGLADGAVVVLHHHAIGGEEFETLEAPNEGGYFEIYISEEYVVAPGIEYYLSATDGFGGLHTHPFGAPDAGLFRVRVEGNSSTPAGAFGSPPEVRILSPEGNAALNINDVLVVVSFYDEDGDLDPSGITLVVNGRDLTRQATVNSEVLTWMPPSTFTSGPLRIEVEAVDLAGNRARRQSTSFHLSQTVAATPAVRRELRGDSLLPSRRPSGRAVFDSRLTDISGDGAASRQEPSRTLTGRLEAGGRYGFMDYKFKTYLTSDEDRAAQPRNRFRLDLDAGAIEASLGDVTPRFNALTIWGKRMRGGELMLRGGKLSAHFLYGETRRDVEGTGTIVPNPGDPLEPIRTIERAGTYRRKLMGLRAGIGQGKGLGFSLGFLKIKDEMESIDFGLKPKDNVVVSADLEMNLFRRRLLVDGSAAMSFLTDDISGGAITKAEADTTFGIDLPFDPENFENILVLNTSTTPLDPRDLSNLAVQSTARGNVLGNLFELRYRRIGSVYQSLAAASLPKDRQGVRVKDTIGIFKRRVRLSGEYETFSDNLSRDKDHTTDTASIAGTLSFTPWSGYLSGLSTGMRLYRQDNGSVVPGEGVSNETRLLTFSGGLRFPVFEYMENLRVSYLMTERTDDISETGRSDGSNMIVESQTALPFLPLSLGVLVGRSTNDYPGLLGEGGTLGLESGFTTLQLSADYDRRKTPIRVTWRNVAGTGNMTGADSKRSSLNISAKYMFDFEMNLTGRAGYASYDDKSDANLDYNEAYFGIGLEQRF